jgi:hypothetical protein
MRTQTFNNALVAVVSAYAEALGESNQANEQLQQALAAMRPQKNAEPPLDGVRVAARLVVEIISNRPIARMDAKQVESLDSAIANLAAQLKGA